MPIAPGHVESGKELASLESINNILDVGYPIFIRDRYLVEGSVIDAQTRFTVLFASHCCGESIWTFRRSYEILRSNVFDDSIDLVVIFLRPAVGFDEDRSLVRCVDDVVNIRYSTNLRIILSEDVLIFD